jgi:signal peptidase I
MPEPPALLHKRYQGTELSLPPADLIGLIIAVHEKGADFRFTASGMSMYPTIKDGDIITLSRVKGLRPAFGDIVAFREGVMGKLVVHRVITASSSAFQAKGDNSPEPDSSVPFSNLLGYITNVERSGVSLLWPDVRRSLLTARVYFRAQYRLLTLKKCIYAIGTKWKEMQRRVSW